MLVNVKHFMKAHFNDLALKPPLFYSTQYGIRFEIDLPGASFHEEKNLRQIKLRSTTIFDHVFQETDEILLVTDIHCEKQDTYLQKHPANVYLKYVENTRLRKRLSHTIMPCLTWEEEDEDFYDMVTHRFVLPCTKSDIRYRQLLSAISYEDFNHPTTILKHHPAAGYDIYFINVTKKMVFHLYDDRGCDVIASDKEDLRSLYTDLNAWILNYDRDQIDRLFI